MRRKPDVDEQVCTLTFDEAGWPCKTYTPGPDGKCITPRPRKGRQCGHLAKCHDELQD